MEGEEEIVVNFCELYSDLYNSANSSQAMLELKEKLSGLIGADSVSEADKVTAEVVKRAAIRMKPGKNYVSESFSSDLILHSPDSMFKPILFTLSHYHYTILHHNQQI